MPRNPEAAHGEAIQALAARLEQWGVDDALAKAHDYVRDLVREGWRPRGPRCEDPVSLDPGRRCPAEQAPAEYLAAKAALRGGGTDA